MKITLGISLLLSQSFWVIPISSIFDLNPTKAGMEWAIQLSLSVTTLFLGAVTIIILLVRHCNNLKTSITDQTKEIKQLKDNISSLEHDLGSRRQEPHNAQRIKNEEISMEQRAVLQAFADSDSSSLLEQQIIDIAGLTTLQAENTIESLCNLKLMSLTNLDPWDGNIYTLTSSGLDLVTKNFL